MGAKRPMAKYRKESPVFALCKRFQLYKKLMNGELMHITSTEAVSLSHAIEIFKDQKRVINFNENYKVSGI